MISLRVPDWLEKHQMVYSDYTRIEEKVLSGIRDGLKRFYPDDQKPDVSIIMPVWNEEKNIIRTLSSISEINTRFKTELILVNNNSTDRTPEILDRLGVYYVNEPRRGISIARQKGLSEARGRLILLADGDTIYPRSWVDTLSEFLDKRPKFSVVHGTYAFIPPPGRSRVPFAIYEALGGVSRVLRGKKRAFLHVYGFNMGFRAEQAREVGGFDTSRNFWSDGVLAYDLSRFGGIRQLKSSNACAWTIPRRVLADGGLTGGFRVRAKKEFGRLGDYLFRRKVKR